MQLQSHSCKEFFSMRARELSFFVYTMAWKLIIKHKASIASSCSYWQYERLAVDTTVYPHVYYGINTSKLKVW